MPIHTLVGNTLRNDKDPEEASSSVGYFFRKRKSLLACDVCCLCLLLILFVVGIANTTFEEQCVNDYETVRRRYQYGWRREEVLVRTCREDLERCGEDACWCQNVDYENNGYNNNFGNNYNFDDGNNTLSDGYCDTGYESTALVPTGGWGAMVFTVAVNLFLLVCCCGSCGLAALFIRDKRAYSNMSHLPQQNNAQTVTYDANGNAQDQQPQQDLQAQQWQWNNQQPPSPAKNTDFAKDAYETAERTETSNTTDGADDGFVSGFGTEDANNGKSNYATANQKNRDFHA